MCRFGFHLIYQCFAIIPFFLRHIVRNADVSKSVGQKFQFYTNFPIPKFLLCGYRVEPEWALELDH